ncbi:hypothetical protein ACFW1A_30680 [Kitasatospora sp. NPDC058965]|uniref:hypothetical protein n=1 Tax=Kitasatospora sp. NPDC058965 TaxID=3346682 RepID=UPI0036B5E4D9
MDTTDLVQSWKNPTARQGVGADHPCGPITLGSGGLGRRSALLSGAVVTALADAYDTSTVIPTLTLTCGG